MANIFQRLISSLTSRPIGQPPIALGQYPIYPAANQQTFVKAYSDNSTVYTIVSLMARKFATIPRYLYKQDEDDKEAPEAKRNYRRELKSKYPNPLKLKKLIKKAYEDDAVEAIPGQLDLANLLNIPIQNRVRMHITNSYTLIRN